MTTVAVVSGGTVTVAVTVVVGKVGSVGTVTVGSVTVVVGTTAAAAPDIP